MMWEYGLGHEDTYQSKIDSGQKPLPKAKEDGTMAKRTSKGKKNDERAKGIEHIDKLGLIGIELAENLRREGYTLMEIRMILDSARSIVSFEQARAYNSYWDSKEINALAEEDSIRAVAEKEPMTREEMRKVMRRIHTGFY